MARKKNRKQKNGFKKKEKKGIDLKRFMWPAVIIVTAAVIYVFFRNLGYFNVEDIKIYDPKGASRISSHELLKLYKGRNIFSVDVQALASHIKEKYPVVKKVVIKKHLPDRIDISIISRQPVARIKAKSYFPVDSSGMVLSPDTKSDSLPVVMGLSMWIKPRVGEELRDKKLEKALQLIKAMEQASIIPDHSVSAIDVSNYRNVSFYFEDGIEVKVGEGDFLNRLKKLSETLRNPALDRSNISYIDIRFNDTVIGPK